MRTDYTNNISTHKARVCKESARKNGWVLEYRCTAEIAMDEDVVIDYAWEYCHRFQMQVKDFFQLTRQIKKNIDFDKIWSYAEKAAYVECRACKCSTGCVELSEYYIIK